LTSEEEEQLVKDVIGHNSFIAHSQTDKHSNFEEIQKNEAEFKTAIKEGLQNADEKLITRCGELDIGNKKLKIFNETEEINLKELSTKDENSNENALISDCSGYNLNSKINPLSKNNSKEVSSTSSLTSQFKSEKSSLTVQDTSNNDREIIQEVSCTSKLLQNSKAHTEVASRNPLQTDKGISESVDNRKDSFCSDLSKQDLMDILDQDEASWASKNDTEEESNNNLHQNVIPSVLQINQNSSKPKEHHEYKLVIESHGELIQAECLAKSAEGSLSHSSFKKYTTISSHQECMDTSAENQFTFSATDEPATFLPENNISLSIPLEKQPTFVSSNKESTSSSADKQSIMAWLQLAKPSTSCMEGDNHSLETSLTNKIGDSIDTFEEEKPKSLFELLCEAETEEASKGRDCNDADVLEKSKEQIGVSGKFFPHGDLDAKYKPFGDVRPNSVTLIEEIFGPIDLDHILPSFIRPTKAQSFSSIKDFKSCFVSTNQSEEPLKSNQMQGSAMENSDSWISNVDNNHSKHSTKTDDTKQLQVKTKSPARLKRNSVTFKTPDLVDSENNSVSVNLVGYNEKIDSNNEFSTEKTCQLSLDTCQREETKSELYYVCTCKLVKQHSFIN
jgi:hypothetical protein